MSNAPRTVVLVSGDGSNLQAILDHSRAGTLGTTIAGVISDRPGVRALERSAQAGVPAWTVEYRTAAERSEFDQRLAERIDELRPDLVVLAGFMRILSGELVARFHGRMLNVHPSLLPKYPGLHTYRRALEAGDRQHGTTVHFVIPALDAGPGIIQYRVQIQPGETVESLQKRIRTGEHLIYPRAMAWVASGRAVLKDNVVCLDGSPMAEPVVIEE